MIPACLRKKAQELKSKISSPSPFSKKAQEEMIGFVVIVVLVFVILLVLLSFSLKNNDKDSVQSYEIDSFIQSFLQYTSECKSENGLEFYDIQKLIFECNKDRNCFNGMKACDVLENELEKISSQSWKVNSDSPIKSYSLQILVEGTDFLEINKGNKTNNVKSAMQEFSDGGNSIEIRFSVSY